MATRTESAKEPAALLALLKSPRRDLKRYASLVGEAGSARVILQAEQGLLADELIDAAAKEIAHWERSGIQLISVLDEAYPDNLRGVHDRPPLLFVAGNLLAGDARAAAVIGSRDASDAGAESARQIATFLTRSSFTVVSGLARGIDTAAHTAALDSGGRTIAVIGNGIAHSYPPENAWLQQRISAEGAVISQFLPPVAPAPGHFPMRNAVMSGMAVATVIVEAGIRSGARTQARLALAHGRPVLLMKTVLSQDWAQQLARLPGVHVVGAPEAVPGLLDELVSAEITAI